MKDISNTKTFYNLWNNLYFKNKLTEILNNYFNIKEEYQLLDLYSDKIKSYFILEGNNTIIYIDFELNDNIYIYNYLKRTSTKKVYFILITNENINNKDIIILNPDIIKDTIY